MRRWVATSTAVSAWSQATVAGRGQRVNIGEIAKAARIPAKVEISAFTQCCGGKRRPPPTQVKVSTNAGRGPAGMIASTASHAVAPRQQCNNAFLAVVSLAQTESQLNAFRWRPERLVRSLAKTHDAFDHRVTLRQAIRKQQWLLQRCIMGYARRGHWRT